MQQIAKFAPNAGSLVIFNQFGIDPEIAHVQAIISIDFKYITIQQFFAQGNFNLSLQVVFGDTNIKGQAIG